MIKVLVVDDEYWIRESMRSVINWESHSFRFLEPAEDGEHALFVIRRERPGILITDISMPFLSGAELIGIVSKEFPETVCIALSGYSGYEFVREAMVAGAIDYLLKPLSANDLLAVLSKAVEKLASHSTSEAENRAIKEELRKASSVALDIEFSAVLHPAGDLDNQARWRSRMDDYELMFSGFTMVIFRTAAYARVAKSMSSGDIVETFMSIKGLISSAFPKPSIVFNYIYKTNEFILITDLTEQQILPVCNSLVLDLKSLTQHEVTGIISRYYYSFSQLREAYNELRMAVFSSKFEWQTCVIRVREIADIDIVKRITAQHERQLSMAAASGNRSMFYNVLYSEIGVQNCVKESWRLIEVRQTVDNIAWIMRNAVAASNNALLLSLDNLVESLLLAVDNFEVTEIVSILDQMMDELFSSATHGSGGSVKETAVQVKEYIDSHYAEELSLSSLSMHFHVDDSYLSRMFKNVVGENLMLYISKRRVERAAELICQGDLSLTEIASLVGYGDYSYFNRVFRKISGMGPREFRDGNRPAGIGAQTPAETLQVTPQETP